VLAGEVGQRSARRTFGEDGQADVAGIAVAVLGPRCTDEVVDSDECAEDGGCRAIEVRLVELVELDALGQAARVGDQVADAHPGRPGGELRHPLRQR